jgi:multidrug efflux pump subunit AcrA (membrane-fusion protein)
MHVKAPQDGIVIYKTGWRDEKKKVGDSTWAGEKILELPDLSAMMAKGEIDEADAGRIAVGQKVTIRLEAHPDVDFKGTVQSIGRTVRRQSWRVPTKVYKVDIGLAEDGHGRDAPGDALPRRRRDAAHRVGARRAARRDLPAPGRPGRWRKAGLRYEEVPLRLGHSNRRMVEVLGGLSEGDLISSVDLRPPERHEKAGPLAAGL